MQSILQNMLDLYQPEKGYEPLSSESATYASSFQMLSIVRLSPKRVRTKWKLGQNRSTEVRRRVASELRRRGQPNDARTADEIERTIC
jgi:predicted FMN-binding regulatory protein PaiB